MLVTENRPLRGLPELVCFPDPDLVKMSDVLHALGRPSVTDHPESAGVYVWVDEDERVLYIGESKNLAVRIGREQGWTRAFRQGFLGGSGLNAAGCGLAVVLARGRAVRAHSWAVAGDVERKATQNALIRLSALLGATPPAQGAGWDYGREHSDTAAATGDLVRRWFLETHPLHVAAEGERAVLNELFAAPENGTVPV